MASFHDDTDYEHSRKKCNFCLQTVPLMKSKPYCHKCHKNCFRECSRCHKPYNHEKFFELNEVRCNTCQRKYLKEKEKRDQKKLQVKKNRPTISSSEDSTSDVEQPMGPSARSGAPPAVKKQKRMKRFLIPIYAPESSDSCDE